MKQKVLDLAKTNQWVQHVLLLLVGLLLTFVLGSVLTWIAIFCYAVFAATKQTKVSKEKLYKLQSTKEQLDQVHDRVQECHWLNMFVHKYWATCIQMVLAPHIETLSSVLTANKPPFMYKLEVGEWTLGKNAPKITQVYTPLEPNKGKYQMDCELLFAPDFSLVIRIEPVKKICVTIQVSDLVIKGRMRLNFQFNPEVPNASVGSFSFIGNPHIQFAIKPMGSCDMLSLPKLEDWLFNLIRNSLNPILVWPQKKEFTLGAGEPRDLHMDLEPITDVSVVNSDELRVPPGFQVLARTITKVTSANLNFSTEGDRIFLCYSREPSNPPITGLAVICPGLGESAPEGFTVVEKTPSGENASTNAGNNGTDMFLCYERDPNKPPITGLAIMNMKEYRAISPNDRVQSHHLNEFVTLDCTPHGHKANLNRKTGGDEIYIMYRGGSRTHTGYDKPCQTGGKGILRVHLLRGEDLKAVDFAGTSDPYCNLFIGDPKAKNPVKKTSQIIYKNCNPYWDEVFLLPADSSDTLTIKVYDHDAVQVRKPTSIGQLQLPLQDLVHGMATEQIFPLDLVSQGKIHIILTAIDFGSPAGTPQVPLKPILSLKSKSTGSVPELGELIFKRSDSSNTVNRRKKNKDLETQIETIKARALASAYVSKTGHLEKFASKKAIMGVGLNQGWQRRWVVLDKHRLKYYRSSKDNADNTLGGVSLKNATIELFTNTEHDPELRLNVITKAKTIQLRNCADSDLASWYTAIASNIAIASASKSKFDTEEADNDDGTTN